VTADLRRIARRVLTWEPVSGFEPLTCRLQEVRPRALSALAARMARVIALEALATLGLSGASFHEPFHAEAAAFVCQLLCVTYLGCCIRVRERAWSMASLG
jgi:hypothetical protein